MTDSSVALEDMEEDAQKKAPTPVNHSDRDFNENPMLRDSLDDKMDTSRHSRSARAYEEELYKDTHFLCPFYINF